VASRAEQVRPRLPRRRAVGYDFAMHDLFSAAEQQAIFARLDKLQPGTQHQWGKMNVAQMLTHCSRTFEAATGDLPRKQKLIGKLFAPFVRRSLLGEKPFPKNSPTDPAFVVVDERDFTREKQHLVEVIDRFVQRGPAQAATQVHSFFGRLSGPEWGIIMYKHLDHHLKQFGA
jgi:hypothetical protein